MPRGEGVLLAALSGSVPRALVADSQVFESSSEALGDRSARKTDARGRNHCVFSRKFDPSPGDDSSAPGPWRALRTYSSTETGRFEGLDRPVLVRLVRKVPATDRKRRVFSMKNDPSFGGDSLVDPGVCRDGPSRSKGPREDPSHSKSPQRGRPRLEKIREKYPSGFEGVLSGAASKVSSHGFQDAVLHLRVVQEPRVVTVRRFGRPRCAESAAKRGEKLLGRF